MTNAFDNRLVNVSIKLQDGAQNFSGLAIYASGRMYNTSLQNECECRIYNLSETERNNILTQASPLKRGQNPPVEFVVNAGRESYGTFILFQGNVISTEITQPPDIAVILRASTLSSAALLIAGMNQSSIATLSTISQSIASSLGVGLDFQATDKQIDNYSFSGALIKQVEKLNQMGGIKAYIDSTSNTLVVQDADKAREGEPLLISANTGMVGIPQVTDFGVVVKIMLIPGIKLGCKVIIDSLINPAANGLYYIQQINFEVANRDNPFWYTLSCLSPDRFVAGTQ